MGVSVAKSLVTLIVMITLPACSRGAETTTAPQPPLPFAAELDTAVHGVIEGAIADGVVEADNPLGFTLTVMVPGYQPWVGVVGESEPGVPVTLDMAFNVGSTTKSFTAALVLQLVEEGKLSLDDRIGEWLPDYSHVDSAATVRQLLSHTSGTFQPNHHPDYWTTVFTDSERVWSREEIYSTFLMEPYAPKGTEWNYSNANYMMLGQIVEEVTGSTVSAELRDRFFEPLGLTRTFYTPEETATGSVAEGWFDIEPYISGAEAEPALEPFSDYRWTDTMAEAGGIFASSRDLATWAQALWGDRTVLSAETTEQMLDFVAPEPDDERGFLIAGYGLGAARFNPDLFDRTLLVIGHSGGALFYGAVAAHLPDYGVSIGAALNSDHDVFGLLLTEVAEVITDNVEPVS